MKESQGKKANSSARVSQSVLDGLPVTVEAVLGVAQVRVGELAKLAKGDSFTLDRKLADAVELKLNGVTIAYGEIVAVGDNFGIRIQEIASEL